MIPSADGLEKRSSSSVIGTMAATLAMPSVTESNAMALSGLILPSPTQ
jgi:hypothetical protein